MSQKKAIFLGIMLFFLAVLAVPAVAAAPGNGGSDVAAQGVIAPTELKMKVNCTWNPWPGYIEWSDANTLPPLPGSGWAQNIVSLNLTSPQDVVLIVTDAFAIGDYFEVYKVDGVAPTTGSWITTTLYVPKKDYPNLPKPDDALANPEYSHLAIPLHLTAGVHYFAFREVGHNWGSGAFFVKFCTPADAKGISIAVGGEVFPSPLTSVMPIVAILGVVSLIVAVPRLSRRLR